MAALYEINQQLAALVDPETGELLDLDAFLALQMERDEKIENMALWAKDLTAEAKMIREEEKALAERRQGLERKAESLKRYLATILAGSKFSTPRVAVSFRKTHSTAVDPDAFFGWSGCTAYLKHVDPQPDLVAIRNALKDGAVIPGATMVEGSSLSIK